MKLKGIVLKGQAMIEVKKWSFNDRTGISQKLVIIGYQQTPVGEKKVISKLPFMLHEENQLKYGLDNPTHEFELPIEIIDAELYVDDSGKAHVAIKELKLILNNDLGKK